MPALQSGGSTGSGAAWAASWAIGSSVGGGPAASWDVPGPRSAASGWSPFPAGAGAPGLLWSVLDAFIVLVFPALTVPTLKYPEIA
jgi:hypothetical protein